MAKIVWTEPALDQLDDIAEYIPLETRLSQAISSLRYSRKLIAWSNSQIQGGNRQSFLTLFTRKLDAARAGFSIGVRERMS